MGPRCELKDWLLDGFDMIEEKLGEALKAPNAEERAAAISEGSGMISFMRGRLRVEAEGKLASFTVTIGFDDDWKKYWKAFEALDRKAFEDRVEEVRVAIGALRSVAELD
jgi:hypothetical protein